MASMTTRTGGPNAQVRLRHRASAGGDHPGSVGTGAVFDAATDSGLAAASG